MNYRLNIDPAAFARRLFGRQHCQTTGVMPVVHNRYGRCRGEIILSEMLSILALLCLIVGSSSVYASESTHTERRYSDHMDHGFDRHSGIDRHNQHRHTSLPSYTHRSVGNLGENGRTTLDSSHHSENTEIKTADWKRRRNATLGKSKRVDGVDYSNNTASKQPIKPDVDSHVPTTKDADSIFAKATGDTHTHDRVPANALASTTSFDHIGAENLHKYDTRPSDRAYHDAAYRDTRRNRTYPPHMDDSRYYDRQERRGEHAESMHARDYQRSPQTNDHQLAMQLGRQEERNDQLQKRVTELEQQYSSANTKEPAADAVSTNEHIGKGRKKKRKQAKNEKEQDSRTQKDSEDTEIASNESTKKRTDDESVVSDRSDSDKTKDVNKKPETALGTAKTAVTDAASSVVDRTKRASANIGSQISGMKDQLVQSKTGTFLTKQFGKITDFRASMTAWFDFQQLSLQQQGKHGQSKLLGRLRTAIGFLGFAGEKYALNPVLGALGIAAAVADWVIIPGIILTQGWVAAIPLKILIEATQWSVLFGSYIWQTWSWQKGFVQNITDVFNATRNDAMISRVLVSSGDGGEIRGLRETDAYDRKITAMIEQHQARMAKLGGVESGVEDHLVDFNTPEKLLNGAFGNLQGYNEGQGPIPDVVLRKDLPKVPFKFE